MSVGRSIGQSVGRSVGRSFFPILKTVSTSQLGRKEGRFQERDAPTVSMFSRSWLVPLAPVLASYLPRYYTGSSFHTLADTQNLPTRLPSQTLQSKAIDSNPSIFQPCSKALASFTLSVSTLPCRFRASKGISPSQQSFPPSSFPQSAHQI